MEKNIQTGKRIQIRREELRMNLGDVAKEVGVAVSTIQRYEKGKIEKIKLPVIEAIAKALRVNPAWLLGETDQMQLPIPLQSTTSFRSPKPIRFPCWATSPGGSPILAEENVEAILEVPVHIKAVLPWRCHGDSMTGAHIHDGDIVYYPSAAGRGQRFYRRGLHRKFGNPQAGVQVSGQTGPLPG